MRVRNWVLGASGKTAKKRLCLTFCLSAWNSAHSWTDFREILVLEYLSKKKNCLVSLCLKANAEMVPKIPSCHYMLLM